MRPGLPDRCTDAGFAGRCRQPAHRLCRPHGRQRLPLLRRRVPAHLSRQGRHAALRHRPQRTGEREPSLRERPLRLRLCAPSPSADDAADPQGRRRQERRLHDRPRRSLDAFPRGDLGGGARPCRIGPRACAPAARRSCAGRVRLGEMLQRRGLSVPETGAHWLRQQQCRSLHAAVSCLVGCSADGGDRLRRGHRDLYGVRAFRRDRGDRRQPDRKPPGCRDLFQAGGQTRRQADRDGSAGAGPQPSRHAYAAVHQRHRRRAAQRAAQCDHHGKALRRAIYPNFHRGICRARRPREAADAGSDGAGLRYRYAPSRALMHGPSAPSSSGAWACRSTPTAPTMRAA